MQGLPTNLLTPNVATATGKVNDNSSAGVNGKVVNSENASGESKGAFSSLFESLLGNKETSANGSQEVVSKEGQKGSGETPLTSEGKIDVLLKNKDQEKNKKLESSELSPEKALSSEVLKNINNLIDKTPMSEVKGEVVSASSNLDQLLKSLKAEKGESVESFESTELDPNSELKAKKVSPLDFLIKESKTNDVGSVETKEGKLLETNPESVSKLGLSSEDFLSQLAGAKDQKDLKNAKLQGMMNAQEGKFDPEAMVQRQMNQSMKAYGQKQNLLNDNVIRNAKDLSSKETKIKSSIDELKSPDMKIGAELANMKEQFIPLAQKQEQGTNTQTQGSEKVLDLSKINTSNTTEIIKKISDYIEQSQVANKDSLDLTVKHESLGQFKIQVNRPVGGNNSPMDMQITTSTSEGHEFFMKNEIGLMKNLSQAGIQLSDLRIVSETGNSSFAGNDSRQSNSQNGSQSGREFMSFEASGDSSHGADRRRELWQEARNSQQQRYGA